VTGIVYEINMTCGMVAVLTKNGDFSIFEMFGDDPVDKGDEVKWKDDTSLGSTDLINITQEETYEVYFQNHWVPKAQLKEQLLY